MTFVIDEIALNTCDVRHIEDAYRKQWVLDDRMCNVELTCQEWATALRGRSEAFSWTVIVVPLDDDGTVSRGQRDLADLMWAH